MAECVTIFFRFCLLFLEKKNGCETADRLLSLGNGFTRHMQTSRNDESFCEAVPKR